MKLKLCLIGLLFTLSSCGSVPTQDIPEPPVRIPPIDCRPYPKPDRITAEDVEPQNRPDGWLLTHEDYLDVYRLNLALIAYQKQTRAIAQHFTACIEQYNQKLLDINSSQ